jgi:hypothetical protein
VWGKGKGWKIGAVCTAVLRRNAGDGVWQELVLSRLGFHQGIGNGGAHMMEVKAHQMQVQLAKRATRGYRRIRLKAKALRRGLTFVDRNSGYVKSRNKPTEA